MEFAFARTRPARPSQHIISAAGLAAPNRFSRDPGEASLLPYSYDRRQKPSKAMRSAHILTTMVKTSSLAGAALDHGAARGAGAVGADDGIRGRADRACRATSPARRRLSA